MSLNWTSQLSEVTTQLVKMTSLLSEMTSQLVTSQLVILNYKVIAVTS